MITSCSDCLGRWGDFNGDGLDDFLVDNRLQLNLGGRLAPPMELVDLRSRVDVVNFIADFNRDGFADLLAFAPAQQFPNDDTYRPDGPTRLWIGNGAGRFTERPMPAGNGRIIHVADFTGDGVPDLLLWDFQAKEITILRSNGDATFALHQVLPWPHEQAYSTFTPADINGDARLDLVVSHEDYLHIYFQQEDGKFGAVKTRFSRMHLGWARFADLNGDGKSDLVFNDTLRSDAGITVLFGDGTGRFPAASRYEIPALGPSRAWATQIEVADFIPGGANEIAFGGTSAGYISILGVVNNQLVEIVRHDVDAHNPNIEIVRFTSNKPQLVVYGQVLVRYTPAKYYTWLVETEGAIAPATVSPVRRRGRAIGRNAAFTGGRFHIAFEGDCPLTSLRNISFEREGIFVAVDESGPIERADAAYLEDGLFLRIHVKDGNSTRVLEGTLTPTALGLSGKMFEWKNAPCDGWQVHRVTASLSH